MASELAGLALSLVVGMGLGVIFFGGLWLTLVKLPTTRWPVLMALGSLMGRIGITVLGFYLVMDGWWPRLLACVLGFIVTRQLMIRRLGVTQLPVEQNEGEGYGYQS